MGSFVVGGSTCVASGLFDVTLVDLDFALGRVAEAKSAISDYEKKRPPNYNFENFIAAHLRLRKRRSEDRLVDGLRKAGLPE